MRDRRTKLLAIGGALVAMGVLLTPIATAGGPVHRNGSGAVSRATPTVAGSVAHLAQPARETSPITTAPMIVAPIPTSQTRPITNPMTTPPTPTALTVPATASRPAPNTALTTIPQNNGGDHDPDNNGGVSDDDGQA
jgi:hypothetical protein